MRSIKRYGFTLIELMIVLVIIGILIIMALPSYKKYVLRARFTEIMAAAEPYKIAVSLALQSGYIMAELNNNEHGIPAAPPPSKNLAQLTVNQGIITAIGSSLVNQATYVLSPHNEGNFWTVSGSCLKQGMCPN
jgi:type IV pilus assembly protein PilA